MSFSNYFSSLTKYDTDSIQNEDEDEDVDEPDSPSNHENDNEDHASEVTALIRTLAPLAPEQSSGSKMFMAISGDLDELVIYSDPNWFWFGLWNLILAGGYIEARLICSYLNTPYDCVDMDPMDTATTLVHMTIYGIPVYWVGNVVTMLREDENVLNKLKRWYFAPMIYLAIPCFSFFGNIESLHSSLSLSDMNVWSPLSWLVYVGAAIVCVILAGYHVSIAYKTEDEYDNIGCNGYLGPYLLNVLVFFLIYSVPIVYVTLVGGQFGMELHHWFLFWFLALFAKFNTVTSISTQAVCIGIFIQGFANYGPDFIF